MRFFVILAIAALLLAFPSFSSAQENNAAAQLDAIAYRIGEKESRYTLQEGTNPLEIRFCVTTTTEYCAGPPRQLNIGGKRVAAGITIAPAIEGEWRWSHDSAIQFTPTKPWPAGQHYTVTFSPNLFPAGVSLNTERYGFTTEPLRPNITSLQFFQDPTELEERLISGTIAFNYPVKIDSAEKRLRFTLQETEGKQVKNTQTLPFTTEWNTEKTEARITVPLQALGKTERAVLAETLPGIEPLSGGAASLVPDAKLDKNVNQGKRIERVIVPSLYSYLKVNTVEAKIVKNPQGAPEQTLVMETNAPVTADSLKEHLEIKLLPKDKPAATKSQSPKKDYQWSSPTEVTPEILAASEPVAFKLTSSGETTLHSVSLTAPAGRFLHATITRGLPAKGGFELGTNLVTTLPVPAYPREVKIMGEGAVLSLGGERTLSLYGLGVDKIDVEIGRVVPGNLNHLISQSYGNFASPEFTSSLGQDDITERFTDTITLAPGDGKTPRYASLDLTRYVKAKPLNKGMLFITLKATEKDKYGRDITIAEDKRFLLVTDLGFLVKTARDASRDVFVMSLSEGEAVDGATVEVLGKNGLPVYSTSTSREGRARIPDLSGMEREKFPVAVVVREGQDVSFMPFNRYDREVNYSAFDTGGITAEEDGLRAFLFSDRGIYRPGEEARIGMLVKQGDWTQSLDGLPLMLTITNPRGQVVEETTVKLNAEGLVEHRFTPNPNALTGLYHARLYLSKDGKQGTQLGQVTLRVEEFLPDTMKITSNFSAKDVKGWVAPEKLAAEIMLAHLYGAPAENNRITAKLSLTPGFFRFPQYKDYVFYDAASASRTLEQPLTEQQTDASGKASFPLPLNLFGDATYQLTFLAEGFAAGGGRSVKTAKTILVSPLPFVVGYKTDGNTAYIHKGEGRMIDFVAVAPDLSSHAADGLKLERNSVAYIPALVKDGSGRYVYQATPRETPVSSENFSIKKEGERYSIPTDTPGDYVLYVKNNAGKTLARIPYHVAGDANVAGSIAKEAKLSVTLDKGEYKPGDEIELSILSPYEGAGLITLETDKVEAFAWFEAKTNASVQHFTLPKNFQGKGFLNVQFVRSLDSREIATSPFSIGMVPVFVSTEALKSGIEIKTPELVKPGQELAIGVKTKHKTKLMLFAIDEGILQFARYQTPDPMGFLVGKRALQVDTTQIFDLLIPEYSRLKELSAAGGDEALNDGKNLNPFKRRSQPPVAFWSGIVEAGPEEKEIRFTVPDYFNGSLRVMAVAASKATIDAAEAKTTVRGDVIVNADAPTFVAPGDTFELPITIANQAKGSGEKAEIQVSLLATDGLTIEGEKERKLTVPEGKDVTLRIRVKAEDKPGEASILATAALAGTKDGLSTKSETRLSVRPAIPRTNLITAGVMEGTSVSLPVTPPLYTPFATVEASVSGLPLGLIPGLVRYLNEYPYGCTEQTVSRAMPSVVLNGVPELLWPKAQETSEQSVRRAISRLRETQNESGAFGTWDADQVDDFLTAYGFHFLLLAKEKHLPVPNDLFESTRTALKEMAGRATASMEQARLQSYAAYLLTRHGEVTSNTLLYLLQYLDNQQGESWKHDLTAAYIAATYQLLQLQPEADALMARFLTAYDEASTKTAAKNSLVSEYWRQNDYYDALVFESEAVRLIAEHFPERLANLPKRHIQRIALLVGAERYHSLSSAYAIQALAAYGEAMKASAQTAPSVTVTAQAGENGVFAAHPFTGDRIRTATLPADTTHVKLETASPGLFYQLTASGFPRTLPDKPVAERVNVSRKLLNTKGETVTKAALGEELTVELTLNAFGEDSLNNVAAVDLLPGGFEVVLDSIPRKAAPNPAEQGGEGDGGGETPPVPDSAQPPASSLPGWITSAVDAREDRVIAYGNLSQEPAVFRYRIKAIAKGSFTLPPPYAESMYDRQARARGVASDITVE